MGKRQEAIAAHMLLFKCMRADVNSFTPKAKTLLPIDSLPISLSSKNRLSSENTLSATFAKPTICYRLCLLEQSGMGQ